MSIASPYLVQLHAPLGWPPRHLGGITDGLATRWSSRSRTQIIESEPRVQLAITPDRRAGAWLSRRLSVRWSAQRVQSSIIVRADTLYSYTLPTASRTRASAAGRRGLRRLTHTERPRRIGAITVRVILVVWRGVTVTGMPRDQVRRLTPLVPPCSTRGERSETVYRRRKAAPNTCPGHADRDAPVPAGCELDRSGDWSRLGLLAAYLE
jgi:hypothetical protein